ncbi:MAG: hypothetical protein RLY29_154 [Actinomycetota bacterium]|jgi:hypothetical protein
MLRRLVLSIALSILATPLASADTGYRYWGYFQAQSGATSWTAAMTGPTIEVKDGDVEGWAFVASSNDIPATPPMMDPDFAALCGEVSEVAGKVRVGLVVDFGAGEIAPEGDTPNEFFSDCVLVPEGSIGLDVLNAALDVRADDSGLICGIAGYPSAECGAEIDMSVLTSSESPMVTSDKPEESGTSTLSMGLLAALAVTIGLIALRRRSK